jgi:hypothetical protein
MDRSPQVAAVGRKRVIPVAAVDPSKMSRQGREGCRFPPGVVWLENSAPENVVSFLRRGPDEEFVTVVNFSNRPQSAAIRIDDGGRFAMEPRSGASGGEAKIGLPDLALAAYDWRIYRRQLKP